MIRRFEHDMRWLEFSASLRRLVFGASAPEEAQTSGSSQATILASLF